MSAQVPSIRHPLRFPRRYFVEVLHEQLPSLLKRKDHIPIHRLFISQYIADLCQRGTVDLRSMLALIRLLCSTPRPTGALYMSCRRGSSCWANSDWANPDWANMIASASTIYRTYCQLGTVDFVRSMPGLIRLLCSTPRPACTLCM